MTGPQITAWFVLGIILGAGVYDGIAWLVWGTPATITDVVRGWAREWPFLPWATLIGMALLWWHLFTDAVIGD